MLLSITWYVFYIISDICNESHDICSSTQYNILTLRYLGKNSLKDTKGVIRMRKSKARHHEGEMKKDKRQTTIYKTYRWWTRVRR